MNALEVALTIMVLNILTFGNGPALVPLLEERFVTTAGILTVDQLLYAFAIARVMPGPANAYVASVGFFLNGLLGGVLAMVAIQLPAYLMLPLLRLHERVRDVAAVKRFTRGLTAASVGLIFASTVSIGRNAITSLTAAIVFVLALVMAYLLKWNPLLSLALAALAGLTLHTVAPSL
jgi:chromate transporter